jgi:hypothetical protein
LIESYDGSDKSNVLISTSAIAGLLDTLELVTIVNISDKNELLLNPPHVRVIYYS